MTDKNTELVPEEGWHCLHLFYRAEYGQWQLLSREEQNSAKTNLSSLVQEVRAMESTQLLTLGMVTPKADIGFMLITPDLHNANKIEKRLSLSLGGDVLTPVYSYLSLTEESEYITTEEEYIGSLESSIRKDPKKLNEALTTFRERHVSDQSHRLQNALRPGQRRVRGLRRVLHRYPIAARRIISALATVVPKRAGNCNRARLDYEHEHE